MRPFFILLIVLSQMPAGLRAATIGASWEFNQDGNAEAWEAARGLKDLSVSGGILQATVTEQTVQLAGPPVDIQASDYGFITLRLLATFHGRRIGSAILRWKNDAGQLGFAPFEIIGDPKYREYEVPLHTHKNWRGRIVAIDAINLSPSFVGARIYLDYIRIVSLGPRAAITTFKAHRVIVGPGRPVPLLATITNTGDRSGKVGGAKLVLAPQWTLLQGSEEIDLGTMDIGQTETLEWVAQNPAKGQYRIDLEVAGQTETLEIPIAERHWRQQRFFLSAWSPPYYYQTESLNYYKDANFDNILYVLPAETAVAKVAAAGMKCMVRLPIVPNNSYLRGADGLTPPKLKHEHFALVDDIIARFKDNPAVIGYFIVDEPSHRAFANLADLVAYIRARDPDRLSYINQHPSSAGTAWFGRRNYEEYLEYYLDVVKPEFLSYDRYHFFKGYDGGDFFHDLATIRRVALKYDVPFCNIVQAIGTDEFGLNWRTPGRSEHRWLVYNSLAYGAKGIVWFHWNSPWGLTGSPEREHLYASIQQANAEINTLGPFLMPLRSTGAYHWPEVPRGAVPLPEDVLVKAVAADVGLVIGLFKDESDNDYFMLVNQSYERPTTASVTLDRAVDALYTLEVSSGAVRPLAFVHTPAGTAFETALPPGGGKLFFFDASPPRAAPTHIAAYRAATPSRYQLRQIYPNPFNPLTTIEYDLVEEGAVELKVYDSLGRQVAVLVDERQKAGRHAVQWRAQRLASGVYFCALAAGHRTRYRKMVLVR